MTLTIGLLGVEVPPEFEGKFDAGVMAYMTAMRLEEVERRILAIEAQGTEAGTAETPKSGSVHDGPVGSADAPEGSPDLMERDGE